MPRDRTRRFYASDDVLGSEALLYLFDPELERDDVVLQLSQIALEDLAPALLIGEPCLDPAQRLSDRLVLLLKAFESAIDLVEVAEHLLSQIGEPEVHFAEPPVHFAELPGQELDELLVLGRRHGPCLPQAGVLFKCVLEGTPRGLARLVPLG